MDSVTQRLMMGAAGAGSEKLYVEDVFSTWLYTGNGSTQSITNGIDLAGKGGLVWTKPRTSTTFNDHILVDSARGDFQIQSNTTAANNAIDSFGFASTGYAVPNNGRVNTSSVNYASWTFRKAAKFFDVVTYTGTGSARTISHNLGSVPGCIIVKRTDSATAWPVYHRSLTSASYLLSLNATDAEAANSAIWNATAPTSTVFSVGTNVQVNASGGTYVAYLFAHDAGGFGDSGNESVVSCGSYTGNGSNQTVSLGWEPQWLLIKRATGTSANWILLDAMRGMPVASTSQALYADSSTAEASWPLVNPTSTGFTLRDNDTYLNAASTTYIYIAIRRGPMKTPTDATKVFSTFARSGTGAAATITTPAFPVDFILGQERTAIGLNGGIAVDRLRGAAAYLRTPVTTAEGSNTTVVSALDSMTGFSLGASDALNGSSSTYANWVFRRAPGFFDVVAYTGTGANRTVSHNLGVAPELMIVKARSLSNSWIIYPNNSLQYLLFTSDAVTASGIFWNSSAPTASTFSLGSHPSVNSSSNTYIAYLFATCPGVSKCFSFTGTGTTKQIDCGFTNGARFVMIKRTDSTGDWYVWDSARGIISGNDPYLLLNSTAAEVTNTDYIDPLNSGFEISSTAPAAINANGGTYIYLAIA